MSKRIAVLVALLAALVVTFAGLRRAQAVTPCGGESDLGACGVANPCGCCAKSGESWPNGTCGNCVWHAWHAACNGWGVAVPWACSDGHTWNDLASAAGYAVDGTASASSIFVCEASAVWSSWGHVGWIVSVNADGSSNTTEQFCSSTNCGTFNKVRQAGFADAYIHHGSSPVDAGPPVGVDNAKFVSETIPDGTKFQPGESFVKRWTLKNSGTTKWTQADGYTFNYIEQEQFGAAKQTQLPAGASVAPSETFSWDVPMTAPSSPGTYRGYWRMNHDGKGVFGDKVWVEIVVVSSPVQDAGTKDTGTAEAGTPDTGTSQDASAQHDAGLDASLKDGAKDGSGGATQSEGGAAGKDGGGSTGFYNKAGADDGGCACRGAASTGTGSVSSSVALLCLLAAVRVGRRMRRHRGKLHRNPGGSGCD